MKKPEETRFVDEGAAFISVPTHAMEERGQIHSIRDGQQYRFSDDSGQGTERNTESLRSHSTSSDEEVDESRVSDIDLGYEAGHYNNEKNGILKNFIINKFLMKMLPLLRSSRIRRAIELMHEIVDRVILILGFIGLSTGFVTYAGIFVSHFCNTNLEILILIILQRGVEVFSGLAHFIKGGVFFWYGILTLGRWAGCFAELGWVSKLSQIPKPYSNFGRRGTSSLQKALDQKE
jgi:hypothetical protein